MLPNALVCPHCHAAIKAESLARRILFHASDMRLHISECQGCGSSLEMRLGDGWLEVGYTYWAGSMHFEAMARLGLPGMQVAADGAVSLDGRLVFTPPA